MEDIFENTIVCEVCNKKTSKSISIKDGHELRYWQCPQCNKRWYHPLDMERYSSFQKIKNKNFTVKLRLVGNSYAVSIPKEIINFENEFSRLNKQMDKMISLCLEEPEKLSLFFRRKIIKQ